MHQENKRECFDGMRAYHQSEIAHKKDAIDILKSVLTTVVLIYGAIIGSIISNKIDLLCLVYASFIIVVVIAVSVSFITYFTNKKIDEDNRRYRKYCDEYVLERDIIGLESDLHSKGYVSAWVEPHDRNRTGYHHTKNILRVFTTVIIVVSIIGALFSLGAYNLQSNEAEPETTHEILSLTKNLECLSDLLLSLLEQNTTMVVNMQESEATILAEILKQTHQINKQLDRHLNIIAELKN